jgi:lipid-A-disaccharide synthase
VVSYKGSWISYFIARALIKNIRYICIVNLICDKKVVAELIQADVNKARLIRETKYILSQEGSLQINADYQALRNKLGQKGASERAASLMLGYLQKGPNRA